MWTCERTGVNHSGRAGGSLAGWAVGPDHDAVLLSTLQAHHVAVRAVGRAGQHGAVAGPGLHHALLHEPQRAALNPRNAHVVAVALHGPVVHALRCTGRWAAAPRKQTLAVVPNVGPQKHCGRKGLKCIFGLFGFGSNWHKTYQQIVSAIIAFESAE